MSGAVRAPEDGAGRPLRLLTVCLGNICRSPTAEAALVEAAAAAGVAVEVRSAGTGDWHVGQPPDPRMRAAADRVGLRLGGVAETVTPDAIAAADLVLAMDRANLADLRRMAEAAGLTARIELFRTFDPEPDAVRGAAGDEVPDPYYGDADGFDEVVAMCRRTAGAVIATLATGGRA
jgi:protein-tyrosine phosphatase